MEWARRHFLGGYHTVKTIDDWELVDPFNHLITPENQNILLESTRKAYADARDENQRIRLQGEPEPPRVSYKEKD